MSVSEPRSLGVGVAAGALIGDCRLSARIGAGGMGEVWQAIQVDDQAQVAVKILSPALVGEPGARLRFRREARAAEQVEHPNVVRCLGHGEMPGICWLVSELVCGGDAAQLVARLHARVPWRLAVAIARDCARGLAAIHAAGLIHRDIKPTNVLLASTDGCPAKLCDFGLVRDLVDHEHLTLTGAALGTPSFMAPEQASGDTADLRPADVYALGATLYYLLTGRLPYDGPTVWAILTALARDPFPDARAVRSDVPDAVAHVLTACTARDIAQRHPSAAALADDLDDLLAGRSPRFLAGRPAPVQPGGPRVMLVDDDPVISRIHQHRLRRDGFAVEVQHDGIKAWDRLQRDPPDVVVLDLMLPGLDGIEILRRMRSDPRLTTIPVAVFTNAVVEGELAAARIAGANLVLGKAGTWPRQLAESLHALLGHGRGSVARSEAPDLASAVRLGFRAHAGSQLAAARRAAPAEAARLLEPLVAGCVAAGESGAAAVIAAAEQLAGDLAPPTRASHGESSALAAAIDAAASTLSNGSGIMTTGSIVLVVDDEITSRKLLSAAMTRAGLKPVEASSLSEARARIADRHPETVVCDLLLGDGMGFSLAKELSASGVPVVLVSGMADADGFVGGDRPFLAKPVRASALVAQVLAEILRRKLIAGGGQRP